MAIQNLRPTKRGLEALGWTMLWTFIATFVGGLAASGLSLHDASAVETATISGAGAAAMVLQRYAAQKLGKEPE